MTELEREELKKCIYCGRIDYRSKVPSNYWCEKCSNTGVFQLGGLAFPIPLRDLGFDDDECFYR